VMGFIRARQNVVAIERDPMFKGLCQHMQELTKSHTCMRMNSHTCMGIVKRKPKLPVVVPDVPVAEEEVAVPAAPESAAPAQADVPADKAAAPPVAKEAPAGEEKKADE
jgi:hypothetical protein